MKNMFTLLIFLTVFWGIQAFSEEEARDAICKFSTKFEKPFYNCTLQNSPAIYRKISNIIYHCTKNAFENDGLLNCLWLFYCYDHNNSSIQSCYQEKMKYVRYPTDTERDKFAEVVAYCLTADLNLNIE